MRETDPNKIRKLGRKVSGYDETEWSKLKYDVVLRGNYAKVFLVLTIPYRSDCKQRPVFSRIVLTYI